MTISHCMFSVSSNSVLAAACEPAAPLPALWVTPSHGGKGSREARRCRVLHWRPGMPVGGLLVLMGHVQQARFAEIGTEQLHAYRQIIGKARRQGDPRYPGEVGGNGVDIGQIQADRIIDLLADAERRNRRSRAENDIHLLEGGEEIVLDQAADLLCLQVVGIVVA